MFLECIDCKLATDNLEYKRCPNCNGFLILQYDKLDFFIEKKEIGIWKYKNLLPITNNRITLGEGNTPIIKATEMSKELNVEIFLKNEGINPTGTFLDRGSAIYLSFLKDRGIKSIKCFTTGNFGCSIAAYSSKANINCQIYVHERVNHFKLLQMIWFGSKVTIGQDKFELEKDFITQADPIFIEGLKTQFYEIYEYFGEELPDYIALPIGSGSNIFSFFKAARELKKLGLVRKDIKFIGAKPDKEASKAFIDLDPTFLYCKSFIKEMIRENSLIEGYASKEEMISSMDYFARKEGILTEPITSISLAVIKKLISNKRIKENSKILIILTGTGLKEIGNISLVKNKQYRKIKLDYEIGYTKQKILEILSMNNLSGYEIWKKLKEIGINIQLPTLYEHLKELEDLNFITSTQRIIKNRKVNVRSITKLGEDYLKTLKGFEH